MRSRRGSAAGSFLALTLLGAAAPAGVAAEKQALTAAQLVEQLASPYVPARREAALALKQLGPAAKEALPALITALSDDDKQVWTNAVSAIAALGPDAEAAIPELLKDLHSRTTNRSRSRYRDQIIVRTAYALTRIGPAAIPPLIEGLRGNDTMLRIGSARALAGMGPVAAEAIPSLLENIGHGDPTVQREAVEALGAIGVASKPKLVEALAWKEPLQRANAALALGAIGKPAQDATAAMLARLKVETDPAARASLLAALPRVGASSAQLIPALIEGIRDDRPEIRHASVNSMLTMRSAQPQIVKALTALVAGSNGTFSERAAYVLGRLGGAAAPAAPSVVAAASAQPQPSEIYLDALVQIGEPAVTPMLVRFEQADPATITREHWVVRTLQQMGGLGAMPTARNLAHPGVTVRLLAARTLSELGADAEPAIPALMNAIDDSDPRVQGAALVALASAQAPLDLLSPRLEAAFKAKSPVLRASAVEAAVRRGTDASEFQPKVIAALEDRDESVRKAVVDNLSESFADAVPALIPMLDIPARRSGVIQALGRVGAKSKPAVPKLIALFEKGTPEERLQILTAFSQIGPGAREALPVLDAARQHKDAAVRVAVIQAQVAIETQNSRRAATLNVGLEDPDREVRRAIASSIARMGSNAVETAPKLIALANDETDREYALAALSQINLRDVPMLLGLLEHSHQPLRLFACRRLENLGRRAKEAVPVLDRLAESTNDPELARAARKAVRSITVK